VEPSLFVVLAAAVLYALGGKRRVSVSRGRLEAGRTAAFAAALLSIVVALDTPLDPLADKLFAAHMAQHVLLLSVAPPLLVLSAPWSRLWQPLPLGFRRSVAKAVVRSPRLRFLRLLAHAVAHPLSAWLLFSVHLIVWHVRPLYDLTLRSQPVHELEHVLLFVTGVLFWVAVLDSPPFRARLGWVWRATFVTSGMLVGWVLAIVLAFATSPIYPAYAHLSRRPGGLSALADQQIAAGAMWVPGSLAYTIAFVVFLYRWLDPEPATRRRLGIAGGR
jgi:cytochrome c oxidase assembly factor CtaG